ncbi:HNH endonuclease, partial [Methylobacterium indicum]
DSTQSQDMNSKSAEESLVAKYPEDKKLQLKACADYIREAISRREFAEIEASDRKFLEGKISYRKHRKREKKLRNLLIRQRKYNFICEICDFQPPKIEDKLHESFFEAHHIQLLSRSEEPVWNAASDMALLCACCHRFIHKLMLNNNRWISIDEARRYLPAGGLSRVRPAEI